MASNTDTLRFVLFGDDRASAAFSRFARNVDEANRALVRENLILDDSKRKFDEISRKADELGRLNPTVKIQIDDAAAKLKLALFRDDLRRSLGGGSAGIGGRGGLGALAGGAGNAAGGAGGGFSWPLAIGIGAGAILAPPVIGAGLGLAGFAAVAIPSLMKISAALTSTGSAAKKAWAALDPGQTALAHQIQGVTGAFSAMAKSLEPVVTQGLMPLLKLAKDLIPSLRPLAIAGAAVLDAFITPLDNLIKSNFFKKFIAEMSGIGVAFAQTFGPTLASLLKSIFSLIKGLAPVSLQLWKALDPLVALLVKDFVKILNQTLPPLLKVLPEVIKAWTPLIPTLTKLIIEILPPLVKIFGRIATDTLPAVTSVIDRLVIPALDALIRWLKPVSDAANNLVKNWDRDWTLVKETVMTILGNIITFLEGIPGKIKNALGSLGSELLSIGKNAMSDLWSGIKSGASSILGWFGGFISSITGFFKKILGINSPSSVFFDIGKNMMLGLENGIKAHAHAAANAAKHVAQNLGGGFPGAGTPGGGSASANYALAQRLFPWPASMFPAFNNVEMREAGYSLTATNASSGAYGMAQFINGPSEYYQYGGNPNTAAGQLVAMFNYIRQRYGNPVAAWAHEVNFGWYGNGLVNGLFTQPTLIGVGERGPEMVNVTPVGRGGGAGNTYNINVAAVTANPAEVGRQVVTAIREFERRSGKGWRS